MKTFKQFIGEEGYDRMRDDRLVKYGIGHDGSDRRAGSSKRTPDNQKIKGKTVRQKETEKKYEIGTRVGGKIVSITDYGAFIELEPGVEGLIHISEMSWLSLIHI